MSSSVQRSHLCSCGVCNYYPNKIILKNSHLLFIKAKFRFFGDQTHECWHSCGGRMMMMRSCVHTINETAFTVFRFYCASCLFSVCWASSLDQRGCGGLASTGSSSCQASDTFAGPTWSQPYWTMTQTWKPGGTERQTEGKGMHFC